MPNKKAVSAVIGVILMIAITIAISSVVYVVGHDWIKQYQEDQNETNPNLISQGDCVFFKRQYERFSKNYLILRDVIAPFGKNDTVTITHGNYNTTYWGWTWHVNHTEEWKIPYHGFEDYTNMTSFLVMMGNEFRILEAQ